MSDDSNETRAEQPSAAPPQPTPAAALEELERSFRAEVAAVRAAASNQTEELRHLVQQVRALAEQGLRQHDLEPVSATLDAVRERGTALSERIGELEHRVTGDRLSSLVEEAVREQARHLLDQEYGGRFESLQDAYDDADDRLQRLRSFIDSYEPGGVPVLHQKVQALEVLLGEAQSELDRTRRERDRYRDELDRTGRDLSQRKLAGELPLEELRRREEQVELREQDVRDRRALESENKRLSSRVAELESELKQWNDRADAQQAAIVDQLELVRLRGQVEDLERDAQRFRRERDSAQREAREAARTRDDATERLRGLEDLERNEEERSRQIDELRRENRVLRDQTQELRADLRSGTRAALEESRQHLDRAERSLAERLEQERRLEQEWRSQHAAELAQERRDLHQVMLAEARHQSEVLAAGHLSRVEFLEGRVQELLALEEKNRELRGVVSNLEQQVALLQQTRELQERLVREELDRADERRRADAESVLHEAREKLAAADRALATAAEQRVAVAQEVQQLKGEIGGLQAERDGLLRSIDDLRERAVPDEERLGQLHRPVFEELAQVGKAQSEEQWLDRVQRGIAEAGFHFHPRLLRAFHTALKIADQAPIVVLAGISGTGKSELPRLYADVGGLSFLPLPVQPSWDSPHDLLGFFNYTDGRLKAEPLARLLWQANHDEELRRGLSVVLLDEMNLARVEYYFAELLSRLEARRGVTGRTDDASRARASVHVDAGPGRNAVPLYLDERVLFVGTMNEDESTLTLSDKVLDRASVLTFPSPRNMKLTDQTSPPPASHRLPYEAWRTWIRPPEDDAISARLNQVNEVMAGLDRPFGHRLFRAILGYLVNYPGQAQAPDLRDHAWSDQVAMKILPRLRGLECDDRRVRDGLDTLETFVPEELKVAFSRARDRDFFSWSGAPEQYAVDG